MDSKLADGDGSYLGRDSSKGLTTQEILAAHTTLQYGSNTDVRALTQPVMFHLCRDLKILPTKTIKKHMGLALVDYVRNKFPSPRQRFKLAPSQRVSQKWFDVDGKKIGAKETDGAPTPNVPAAGTPPEQEVDHAIAALKYMDTSSGIGRLKAPILRALCRKTLEDLPEKELTKMTRNTMITLLDEWVSQKYP